MIRECQCALGCTCPVIIEGDILCLFCKRKNHRTRDEQELAASGPVPIPRLGNFGRRKYLSPVYCAWCKVQIKTEGIHDNFRSRLRQRVLDGRPCFCAGKKCSLAFRAWLLARERGEIRRPRTGT